MLRTVAALLSACLLAMVPAHAAGGSLEGAIATATGIDRSVDGHLQARAEEHAAEMAAADRLWHSSLSWGEAEVIGWVGGYQDPQAAIVAGWRNSPDHWAVLTDPSYSRIGCGAAERLTTTQDRWYYACLLALPQPTSTPDPAPTQRPHLTPPPAPRQSPFLLPNTATR